MHILIIMSRENLSKKATKIGLPVGSIPVLTKQALIGNTKHKRELLKQHQVPTCS